MSNKASVVAGASLQPSLHTRPGAAALKQTMPVFAKYAVPYCCATTYAPIGNVCCGSWQTTYSSGSEQAPQTKANIDVDLGRPSSLDSSQGGQKAHVAYKHPGVTLL